MYKNDSLYSKTETALFWKTRKPQKVTAREEMKNIYSRNGKCFGEKKKEYDSIRRGIVEKGEFQILPHLSSGFLLGWVRTKYRI